MIRPSARRRGFTMVELLVVILIIAVLAALLLPAILAAVNTAKDASILAEVNNLGQALADFKNKYGDYPPSRVILYESGTWDTTNSASMQSAAQSGYFYGFTPVDQPIGGFPLGATMSATDLTVGQVNERSVRFLRKFFPRATILTTSTNLGGVVVNNGHGYDFNGNGNPNGPDGPILLEGHECLCFFLGGIPVRDTNTGRVIGMSGFGKNPQNPFTTPPTAVTPGASGNRTLPNFEFRNDRLWDDDGDGIPGYVDSLATDTNSRYYAYFSAYGNNGYDPNDVNLVTDNDGTYRQYTVSFFNPNNVTFVSFGPNPYTSSDPVGNGTTPTVFQQPQSFQIISAGRDRAYGPGGQYAPAGQNERLPADAHIAGSDPAGARALERDNLTNFATSRLE